MSVGAVAELGLLLRVESRLRLRVAMLGGWV